VAKRQHTENITAPVKGEQRINEILDVAAEAFLEFGYEATSVSAIARRAKASKETFYSRYRTKEELFKAVVFRKTESVIDQFRSLLSRDLPLMETLISFGDALLDLLLQPDSIDRLRIVSMESRRFPVVGQELFYNGPERVSQLLTTYLKERQSAGELREMDAELAAQQFVGLVSTNLVRKALLGIPVDAPPQERSRRIRSAVDLFLAGYEIPKRKSNGEPFG
jgi:TetR/AcrR family transcriptional regulator, mexJK operon transcriptional repressor